MAQRSFSPEFKEAIIRKLLVRGNQSILTFCLANGLAVSTVTGWLSKYGNGSVVTNRNGKSKHSAEEILTIIAETYFLKEEELGLYLRQRGLYQTQLNNWRSNVVSLINQPRVNPNKKDGRDIRIIELERDLKRKNAALAEASALLILQKKIQEIWPTTNADVDH